MAQLMDRTSNIPHQSEQRVLAPLLEATRNAPPTTPAYRKRRVNRSESLFNAIWMALMLSCTVTCISRLLWAVQP